jgi:hypothetical protein
MFAPPERKYVVDFTDARINTIEKVKFLKVRKYLAGALVSVKTLLKNVSLAGRPPAETQQATSLPMVRIAVSL